MPPTSIKAIKHEFVSLRSVVDENDFAVTVGFCRDPANENTLDALLLQRGRDKKDQPPSVQDIYLEIPIQRHVAYGGILEAKLVRDSFTIRFNECTSAKMDGLQEIVVRFELSDDAFTKIRDGLRFVFTGCTCYL